MVTVLKQLSDSLRRQQKVDHLVQQRGGLDESDDCTEDRGGKQNHLFAPENMNTPAVRLLRSGDKEKSLEM